MPELFQHLHRRPSSSPTATTVASSTRPSIMKFSSEPLPRSISTSSLEARSNTAAAAATTTAMTTSSSRWLASDRLETCKTPTAEKKSMSRCPDYRKRVGLTGFSCHCADHRYSDRHNCSCDYKAAECKAIVRENPMVKTAKIVKV